MASAISETSACMFVCFSIHVLDCFVVTRICTCIYLEERNRIVGFWVPMFKTTSPADWQNFTTYKYSVC